MTNEEQAIRQFLSRPAPSCGPCGCMGPRVLKELEVIDNFKCGVWPYNPNDLEPLCRCAMRHTELVNGVYYEIIEHRSPTGITHEAEVLGPVGGPYTNLKYENSHAVVVHKKTAAQRIQELRGVISPKRVSELPFNERVKIANELALDPKNYSWTSQTVSKSDGSFTKTEIVNGKFVVTKG